MAECTLDQVTGRDHGVHVGIREGLLARGRSQVNDSCNVLCHRGASLGGQEVSGDYLHAYPMVLSLTNCLQFAHVARGSDETAHITKSKVEQPFNHSGSDETGRAGKQDQIVVCNEKTVVLRGKLNAAWLGSTHFQ